MDQMRSYLGQWKNRALLYGGRVQLTNLILQGKLAYWFQPSRGSASQCPSTKLSPCWGLHWLTAATFTWHIWEEHNKFYKEHITRPPVVVAKEFIHDIGIIYSRGKYKNAHRSRLLCELRLKANVVGYPQLQSIQFHHFCFFPNFYFMFWTSLIFYNQNRLLKKKALAGLECPFVRYSLWNEAYGKWVVNKIILIFLYCILKWKLMLFWCYQHYRWTDRYCFQVFILWCSVFFLSQGLLTLVNDYSGNGEKVPVLRTGLFALAKMCDHPPCRQFIRSSEFFPAILQLKSSSDPNIVANVTAIISKLSAIWSREKHHEW